MVVAAGFITGPILGGILLDWLNWRSIFYVRVPIALLVFAIFFFILKKDKKEVRRIGSEECENFDEAKALVTRAVEEYNSEHQPSSLAFLSPNEYRRAWNLELAYAFTDDLELAFRYEGSRNLGTFMPEKQYGAVLNWGVFKNTSLAVEYLHGTFENKDKRSSFTAQFAVEF